MAVSSRQVPAGAGAPLSVVDLAMVGVALIWGINASVVKFALRGWDPMAFNAVRLIIAAAMIFAAVRLMEGQWRLERRDILPVMLLGLVGNGLYQWLFIEAISHSTASNIALMIGLSPLMVTLGAALTGLERMTGWVMSGTALSVAGVALVIAGQQGGFQFSGGTLLGDMMGLVAAACWAAYTLFARPVIARVGSAQRVTAWAMACGAFANLLFAVPALAAQPLDRITSLSWFAMVYSAMMALAVGYLIYTWAVRRVGGARTAIYLNLTPVFAAVVAGIALGESWTLLQWTGAITAICGLTVAKLEALRH